MKVAELIEKLRQLNKPDHDVVISDDAGFMHDVEDPVVTDDTFSGEEVVTLNFSQG